MVFAPTTNGSSDDADPEATVAKVPEPILTSTVAFTWFTVGVTVTLSTELITEEVYEVFVGEKPPARVACERIKPESFASFDFVYVNLLALLATDGPDALTTKISMSPRVLVAGAITLI